jgi:hypothetical protein
MKNVDRTKKQWKDENNETVKMMKNVIKMGCIGVFVSLEYWSCWGYLGYSSYQGGLLVD